MTVKVVYNPIDYPNQSDLKIFFVKYKNQSGWRDKSKQH